MTVQWDIAKHSKDDVTDAVADALADDRRDAAAGGVHAEAVAEYLTVSPSTTAKYLRDLYDRGELARLDGLKPGTIQNRTSYLPADHPDVAEDTRGRPTP